MLTSFSYADSFTEESDSDSLLDLSLEELSQVKVIIATAIATEQTLDKAPATVTVIKLPPKTSK
ncbi:MAG: hypothetical protein LC437_03590 [Thiohalomonas sp.]|nr:hypothetical protein [Thiohalomonas sp.]